VSREIPYVFTARFNPIRWQKPDQHFAEWVQHIRDSGGIPVVAEVTYGTRPYACDIPGVEHVGLRADSWAWSKENALNLAIQRYPQSEIVIWEDSDVIHRKSDWLSDVVHALDHYHVIQTWSKALDLGPNDELIQVHTSFADCYMQGKPLVPKQDKFWKFNGGYEDYPHTGYSWACKRDMLNHTGGLFELAGMGSADHHMAHGFISQIHRSVPAKTNSAYLRHLLQWQSRANSYVNGRIGIVHGIIEHRFHGSKVNRKYLGRWDLFVKHDFNPDTDLKRNSHGVLEWAGNKPELEREWDQYLRSRREDENFV